MKVSVVKLDASKAGDLELSDAVFGIDPRKDILARVVNWQLAKRRAGTHKVKERNEISRTGKKFGNQKGGGGARHGSRRSNIFVGGGVVHGPRVRDHGHDLQKKVRVLGLKSALSARAQSGDLIVVDSLEMAVAKTKDAAASVKALGLSNALFIDGAEVNENFGKAISNIVGMDVLPGQGANVYDILRKDKLVLSKSAVEALEARLS